METPKLFTDQKKPMARYTMVCHWKPEFQRVNSDTGEVITKWTFRGDLEFEKLTKAGQFFHSELQALNYLYKKYCNRCIEITAWDNSLTRDQALLFHACVNDKGKWEITFTKKKKDERSDYIKSLGLSG